MKNLKDIIGDRSNPNDLLHNLKKNVQFLEILLVIKFLKLPSLTNQHCEKHRSIRSEKL